MQQELMKTNCPRLSFLLIGLLLSVGGTTNAAPFGTAFTYQGRLADGTNAANNLYDLDFTLFDAPTGGSQLGLSVTYSGYPVSNGLFTVALDFGTSPFNGDARWLQIQVRTNGGLTTPYTLLSPRQALTASPYALYALNVGTAVQGSNIVSGTVNSNALDAPTRAQLALAGTGGGGATNAIASTNGTGYGTVLVNPMLYSDGKHTGVVVTNLLAAGYPATPFYTNGTILYWPTGDDTNYPRKGIVIHGSAGRAYEQLFWDDHGDSGPEMVTTIDGRLAYYYTAIQFGNPSGGSGSEFWWNVSGRTPFIKGGTTNFNLTESQNPIFYEAAVWTNSSPITTSQNMTGPPAYGSGWTIAGSLGDGLPATHFRATSTNGSGAWVWYDKMTMPMQPTWPDNYINYDAAVERFRITVGPDGGATLVGTMNATAFVGDGSGLSNLNPSNLTNGMAGISITGNAATATSLAGVSTSNIINAATLITGNFTSVVCGYLQFTNGGTVYSLVVSTNLP